MRPDSVGVIQKRLLQLGIPFDPKPWEHVHSEEEAGLFSYFVPPARLANATRDCQTSIHILCGGGGKTALSQWVVYRALWQPSLTVIPVLIKLSEFTKRQNGNPTDPLLFNLQMSVILFVSHYFPLMDDDPLSPPLLNLFSSIGDVSHLATLFPPSENKRKVEEHLVSVFGAPIACYVQAIRVGKIIGSLLGLSRVFCPISFWDAAKNVMDILGCNLVVVVDDDINCHNSEIAMVFAEEQENLIRNRIPTISFWSPEFYESWEHVALLGIGDVKCTNIVWSKELLRAVINERLHVSTHGHCPSLEALFPFGEAEDIENNILKGCNTPRECLLAAMETMKTL